MRIIASSIRIVSDIEQAEVTSSGNWIWICSGKIPGIGESMGDSI